MACGCQSACGCTVVGDNETTDVVRETDTFIVSARQFVSSVEDTDCVALGVTPEGVLTAAPIIDAPDATVPLSCGPDGLTTSLIIDPTSTAPISQGPSGLRVDCCAADDPAAARTGEEFWWEGVSDPAYAVELNGVNLDRFTYADLWDHYTLLTTAATRMNGSPIVTGASTRFMYPGLEIEATGFSTGTVVLTVDSPTQVTLDTSAGSSGADTEVRIYPHGIGDGAFTFGIPDMQDVFPLGWSPTGPQLGTNGGSDSATLVAANLPAHTHPVTDPGHDHGASSVDSGHFHTGTTDPDGGHFHGAGTASPDLFVTVDKATDSQQTITEAVGGAGDTFSIPVNPGATPPTYQQGTREFTSTAPNHDHGFNTNTDYANVTTDVTPNTTGVTVGSNATTNDPITVTPPYRVGRWMVHV